MHNKIYKEISENIKITLDSVFPDHGQDVNSIYKLLGSTPNLKMGHIAYPCFPLAKTCKKAPNMISGDLATAFKATGIIKEALQQGPYLNFILNFASLDDDLIGPIQDDSYFNLELTDHCPKTMIEYSQPNTHKEMHVGHMRNLCLGNAIVRIKKYCNQEVIATTYPGDSGTHVAKCLWYMKYHNTEAIPETNKGAWLGTLYTKGNLKLTDELGTDKEAQNREELTAILKEMESEKGEFYDLWIETKKWSIDLMNEAYDWADVKFDRWFFESEVDSSSLKLANELYEQGKLIKDEGAIGMDLSDDKLGFCMLVKSDGNGLYSTKDVSLAKLKFEEFGIKSNIYIVDNRQALHFKQVFKVLENIGFEQAKDCYHLQYDVVELPDGAMSSRKGNIVPLMQLIAEMEKTITNDYLERYRGDWTDEEITTTARMVANGAIKYGMIRVDNNRKIVFDMKEWLKLDGETGPYLQYVHARIYSLCQKMEFNKTDKVDLTLLQKDQEIALVLKLNNFNETVQICHEQNKTIHLCSYLYELGKLFNSFYAECPIGKAESEDLKRTRLALASCVGKVMAKGLELIGIPAPLKM
jgi:arginyl-tRNA synthetase